MLSKLKIQISYVSYTTLQWLKKPKRREESKLCTEGAEHSPKGQEGRIACCYIW